MRSCCSLGHDASLTPGKDAFVKKVTKVHETTVKKKSTNRRGWYTKEAMEKKTSMEQVPRIKLVSSELLHAEMYEVLSYIISACTHFVTIHHHS